MLTIAEDEEFRKWKFAGTLTGIKNPARGRGYRRMIAKNLTSRRFRAYSNPASAKSGDGLDIPESRRMQRHHGRFFVALHGGLCEAPSRVAGSLVPVCQPCTARHHLFDISVGGLLRNQEYRV